jgi:hypothetical protein
MFAVQSCTTFAILRGKASKIKERRNADGSNIIEPTVAKKAEPVAAADSVVETQVEEAVVETPAAVEAVAEETSAE